jgi:hypothetical protein
MMIHPCWSLKSGYYSVLVSIVYASPPDLGPQLDLIRPSNGAPSSNSLSVNNATAFRLPPVVQTSVAASEIPLTRNTSRATS